MDDCRICPKSRRAERSRCSPRRRRYRAVADRKRRCSPRGCDPCSREDLLLPRKPFTLCGPCEPRPCQDRCCAVPSESGLLNTIRSSIQRLFTGRRATQLYMYTMSQLKCMEQLVEKLENETCCIEGMIKEALDCECNIDCNEIQCTLSTILNRVEGIKCDVMCARNCYDPCRDRCEFEFICGLIDRVCDLEGHLQDMCVHVDCLQGSSFCDPCCVPQRNTCRKNCCSSKSPGFSIGCPKPCECSSCCNKGCDSGCRPNCSTKPKCCGPANFGKLSNICSPKGLCRTNSVIPVGVMLVKL